jgi:transcriptional regulator NrdR family protein
MKITQVDWVAKRDGLQRRRVCPNCNGRFTTIETVIPANELHIFGRAPK